MKKNNSQHTQHSTAQRRTTATQYSTQCTHRICGTHIFFTLLYHHSTSHSRFSISLTPTLSHEKYTSVGADQIITTGLPSAIRYRYVQCRTRLIDSRCVHLCSRFLPGLRTKQLCAVLCRGSVQDTVHVPVQYSTCTSMI